MCISWTSMNRMNREVGSVHSEPIPRFIEYSHAAWYPNAMKVVEVWCMKHGPHACIRKGYGTGDICFSSINLSGCTCTDNWV